MVKQMHLEAWHWTENDEETSTMQNIDLLTISNSAAGSLEVLLLFVVCQVHGFGKRQADMSRIALSMPIARLSWATVSKGAACIRMATAKLGQVGEIVGRQSPNLQ